MSGSGFVFVLHRPKHPGNVGAAARALANAGFAELRLVDPRNFDHRAALRMAVHAAPVVEGAKTYSDLAAALADCSLSVGTTSRQGPYRDIALPVRDAAVDLAALARVNRVAIVFGTEDTGLTNEELKLCQRLLTIPAAPAYPSLNLAQAVMVVAYELMMAAGTGAAQREPAPEFASAAAVDAMFERMAQALIEIGFLPHDNPDHIMFTLRAVLGRSGLSARELDIFNGLARQIGWFARGGHETVAAKRKTGQRVR